MVSTVHLDQAPKDGDHLKMLNNLAHILSHHNTKVLRKRLLNTSMNGANTVAATAATAHPIPRTFAWQQHE